MRRRAAQQGTAFSVICLQLFNLINGYPKKFNTKHVKLYLLPIFNFKKITSFEEKELFLKFENFEVMWKLGQQVKSIGNDGSRF